MLRRRFLASFSGAMSMVFAPSVVRAARSRPIKIATGVTPPSIHNIFLHVALERGSELAEVARDRGPKIAKAARERGAVLADIAQDRSAQLVEVARERAPELASAARDRGSELATRHEDHCFSSMRRRNESILWITPFPSTEMSAFDLTSAG